MSARLGLGLMLLLAGCFAEPSSGSSGEGDGTGSTGTSSTSTSAGVSSAAPSTSTGEPATTEAADSSSTTATPGTSSTGEGSSSTTGPTPTCPDGQVQVGALCLTPLVVDGAISASQPDALGPFADMCQRASCAEGIALGGGFELDGVRATASHRDPDAEDWISCGAPDPEAAQNLWRTTARCALGEGDVVVSTDTFELQGNEGPSCFESSCPPGLTLVGGGGRWPRFVFTASEPSDDASSWRVCGSGAGEATTVEVDAHCALLPEGTTTSMVEETQLLSPDQTGCVQASCTQGVLVAGGVATGLFMIPVASYADDDRWTACGYVSAGVNVEIRSRALCL